MKVRLALNANHTGTMRDKEREIDYPDPKREDFSNLKVNLCMFKLFRLTTF